MARASKSVRTGPVSRRQFLREAGGVTAAGMVLGASVSTRVLGANERLGVGFIGCGGRSGSSI